MLHPYSSMAAFPGCWKIPAIPKATPFATSGQRRGVKICVATSQPCCCLSAVVHDTYVGVKKMGERPKLGLR